MANIGDFGFFGFADEQNVVARRCVVTGKIPGNVYGPSEPDHYWVEVFVSTLDDALLNLTEQFQQQPQAGGYQIPRLVVERECVGQATGPTAGSFWIP